MTTVDKSRFRPTPVLRPRRRKTMAHVRMVVADGSIHHVVVENASLSGIQAIAREACPHVGDMVTLHLAADQDIWGIVRWTEGLRFGVEVDNSARPTPTKDAASSGQSICRSPTRR